MSIGNRGVIAAVAGLALGYPIHDTAYAQRATPENQTEPAKDADPTSTIPVEDPLARIARAVEAAQGDPYAERAEQRAESDLQAQQDMAHWAKWMFFVTSLTVVVTGLGVFLVWRTLIHTRRASKYAGVAARQARRAAVATDSMAMAAIGSTEAAIAAAEAGHEANRIAREAQQPKFGLQFGDMCIDWLDHLELAFACYNTSSSIAHGVQVVFTIHIWEMPFVVGLPTPENIEKWREEVEAQQHPFAALQQPVVMIGMLSDKSPHERSVKGPIRYLRKPNAPEAGVFEVRCIAHISGLYRGEEIKEEVLAAYYISEDKASRPFKPMGPYRWGNDGPANDDTRHHKGD